MGRHPLFGQFKRPGEMNEATAPTNSSNYTDPAFMPTIRQAHTTSRSVRRSIQYPLSPSPVITSTHLSARDESPKPLLRASTTFYDRIITDWWWWELGSWFVSFSCVTTIIALLLYYDGRKQPNHVIKGITLNAFIAVFAAIAKAALILPVSEAIGQLKWIWFRRERRLIDFLLFDNASRGPWGSLIALRITKGR